MAYLNTASVFGQGGDNTGQGPLMSFDNTPNVYDSENSRGTISPLPPVLVHGLGAVATFGFVSFITTTSLFLYLTYKLISWQLNPPPASEHGGSNNGSSGSSSRNSSRKGATSPVPESPTTSDVNGFLVPDSHLCPQKDIPDWDAALPRPRDTFWQRLRKEPPNQFLVLIYNLLFADIQQATAFLLNVKWLTQNAVAVGTPVCWVQGWFVSIGDLASSVFITAIAVHTYLGVVRGYRLPTWAFYSCLIALWGFVFGMALLGIIITNNGAGQGGLYVRAGAWCWINSAFQDLRLYLHYLWIFLALALTSLIYLVIFVHLHRQSRNAERAMMLDPMLSHGVHYPNPDPNVATAAAAAAATAPSSPRSTFTDMSAKRLPPIPSSARHPTFLLYPLIYVLCTMPLAAGRIASMAGNNVSLAYFCFAGAMIASAGWLDVALYSSTRRAIVFSGEAPPSQDTGLETFAFMRTPAGRKFGNVVFVSGGDGTDNKCHEGKRWRRWNEKVVAGARLRGLRSEKNASQPSLKGFGSGAGEIMGMAIQCDTITSVTVEVEDKQSDTASLSSRKGSIISNLSARK
ncbi:Glucose receptor Git3 [Niveomyces insectorum RCEF 264]|uniref:Glucose receptor Git3 n=1 Tax=Niveomyces insectorum RCEF 264 TaxID=1081102 RepID=A0A167XZ97_9HYPO|nr:Glucose receptor Git3 [Niveomyces insectorum RCEF 264]